MRREDAWAGVIGGGLFSGLLGELMPSVAATPDDYALAAADYVAAIRAWASAVEAHEATRAATWRATFSGNPADGVDASVWARAAEAADDAWTDVQVAGRKLERIRVGLRHQLGLRDAKPATEEPSADPYASEAP